jgi:hypothetical protein
LPKCWIIFSIWHGSSLKTKVVHWCPSTKTKGQETCDCLRVYPVFNRSLHNGKLDFRWQVIWRKELLQVSCWLREMVLTSSSKV